jgi:hypothetical protein
MDYAPTVGACDSPDTTRLRNNGNVWEIRGDRPFVAGRPLRVKLLPPIIQT